MVLTIHARDFMLSAALKAHIHEKMQSIKQRYGHKISVADVRLFDVNGPKGGDDMRCRIVLKPRGNNEIVVQDTSANMYEAINRCTHRIKRHIERSLTPRLSQRERRSGKREAPLLEVAE